MLIQVFMAFRTVGFLPHCPDVYRMPEFESLSYVGKLHPSLLTLADNSMAEITIPCYYAAIFRFKSIIMTPETAIRLKVPDMFRILIVGNFHFWEGILAECFLNRGDRTIYQFPVICIKIIIIRFVKA